MSKKFQGSLIGVVIGAGTTGLCTQSLIWAIVGAVSGGLLGLIITVSWLRMVSERESGATW